MHNNFAKSNYYYDCNYFLSKVFIEVSNIWTGLQHVEHVDLFRFILSTILYSLKRLSKLKKHQHNKKTPNMGPKSACFKISDQKDTLW